MWLQIAAVALGGTTAATRVDVYSDGEVSALMPVASVNWEGKKSEIGAGYSADVVSGATRSFLVDAVSSATTFHDLRNSVNGSLTLAPSPTVSVGTYASVSTESDYLSRTGGLSGSVELFDRMSVVEAGWTATFDDAGRREDIARERSVSHDLDVSWDQIVGPTTRVAMLSTVGMSRCGEQLGCLGNPYRYVGVVFDDGMIAVPERTPGDHYRVAGALRAAQAVGSHLAVKGGYRLYEDSWGIVGHTGDLSGTTSFADDRGLVVLKGRVAVQSAASFYRDRYAAETGFGDLPGWRTADRELSSQRSWSLGARAEWSFDGKGKLLGLVPGVRVARTQWSYPEFSELPRRVGWLLGGGIDAEF